MGGRAKRKVRFTVEFTTWTDGEGEELGQRLRGLLKVAGRRFGMCAGGLGEVEEVTVRTEPRIGEGAGKAGVCPGWRSASGQGRFW